MKTYFLLGALLVGSPAARAQAGAGPPADTTQFPLTYCTALPRADFAHWDKDYATYARFLTPEIRRTQVGLDFNVNGVRY